MLKNAKIQELPGASPHGPPPGHYPWTPAGALPAPCTPGLNIFSSGLLLFQYTHFLHDITEILLKVALNTITLSLSKIVESECCINCHIPIWCFSSMNRKLVLESFMIIRIGHFNVLLTGTWNSSRHCWSRQS